MIVSHRYRFVFIKTRKTAGSSIEAALWPHLGPRDVITGSVRDGTPRRNCDPEISGHMGWRGIVERMGRPKFTAYARFCVVRNPYEKAVSDWLYHRDVIGDTDLDLADYVLERRPSDWDAYTDAGKPIVRVLRYEALAKDFRRFAKKARMPPIDITAHRLKVNTTRDRPHADFLDDRARTAIAEVFAREIAHFGYQPC